jgi:hypothetical protein
MVPRAPPTVATLPVLRSDWETLPRLTSTWSKPLDLYVCPTSLPSVGFEAQTTNRSRIGFKAQIEKLSLWFLGPNHQIVAVGFDVKSDKTVATGFDAKSDKTVPVDLRPNYWQVVNLGFNAQPRNLRPSSPRAQCRPHTASPDLLIIQPPSTRPVRPSLVLYTRSPTLATFIVTARYIVHTTCTTRDKQTRFFTWYIDKDKTIKIS